MIYKLWTYIKSGKNEINFVQSSVNLILLLMIKTGRNFTTVELLLFGVVFISISLVVGIISQKKILPQNAVVNPYVQDFIMTNILTYEAILSLLDDDKEKAISYIETAKMLRSKWLDESYNAI